MPADRRIEYRVVNGKGREIPLPFNPTRATAESLAVQASPAHGPYCVQQRTITVGPWTDVEGERDARP
jgi:hypothetical protein